MLRRVPVVVAMQSLRTCAFAQCVLLLACVLAAISSWGCASTQSVDLTDATRAYHAGEYARSLSLARAARERASGLPRLEARYLEGLVLVRLGRFEDAIVPLEEAADAPNRSVAARARVTLGTALVGSGDFGAAGDAYTRASHILDGEEKDRASALAAAARARASGGAAAASPSADAAPSVSGVAAPVAPDRRDAAIASDPAPSQGVGKIEIDPIRFAIQAGAFRDRQRALDLAAELRPKASLRRLSPPRVVEKQSGGGSVFVVQFGSFPNRVLAGEALMGFPHSGFTVERLTE